ncbi:stalk domain-containing protein [Paenibacillus sp. FSL H7-0331]|uniref:stalk domain-containing protein n=1 Tax=Paenibacillus sp. FSL H7-0331 TaxID=1920421 RepID=UPI00096FA9D5|nr:hypothetical protein [Paenibacillus sp. FSL H7-0331]OME97897.1 hypothetical protein BK127_39965 [Paenibacillus sp. FSL H7-0331]
MKRCISYSVLFMFLLVYIFVPLNASANESEYTVFINGQQLNTEYVPVIRNNAIFIPLWDVIGQLKMSAEDKNGVIRINHPSRVLLIVPDQTMMTYFGSGMDEHNTRLEYSIISQDYVLYAPLTFLSEYLDMQIAYGEDGKIDITTGNFSKDISWTTVSKNKQKIEMAASILKLDTDAETFWRNNPVLWNKYRPVGYVAMKEKYKKQNVISFNGTTVTLANNEKQYTVSFVSMDAITQMLITSDPLESYNWSEEIKTSIRQEIVRTGMTRPMVELTWGTPSDIYTYKVDIGFSETWIYKGDGLKTHYLHFDWSGKVSNIES